KPEIQQYIYDVAVQAEGAAALREIARPGLSEHQLGSTVDLTDASIGFAGTDAGFATGVGGLWLQQHAHEYGFIMSYPEGKQAQTGFKYEPWHWRYVGADAATRLRGSGLTYNEGDFDMSPSPLTALKI
ncbi:MAG: M15 family metallopeptidase, partial [bacterium]|nr:M15 family metallopeptidase [bacterium]